MISLRIINDSVGLKAKARDCAKIFMEGAYRLHYFYDNQKGNCEFGLAYLAFEGQTRTKETRASISV